MRLTLFLAALAAVLGVVLWSVLAPVGLPTGPLRQPGPEPSVESARPGTSRLAPEGAGGRREPAPAQATAASPSVPLAQNPIEASAALELVVLERHSRKPLADFALDLRQDDVEDRVRTDAAGRARTAARWTRGVVSLRHRPDEPGGDRAAAWELEPWQVELPGDAREREVVVLAERPELVLQVEAVDGSGAPLEGAEVSLVHGWRDRAGGFHSEWVDLESSDALGRARFALFGEQARGDSLMLTASLRDQGLESPASFLDPPLSAGPWRLVLEPTGTVLVRAFDEQGRPLGRGFLHAVSDEVVQAAMTSAAGRLEAGLGRLEGLGPGRWRVCTRAAELDDERWVVLQVQAGRETSIEVRFDDGTTSLAAAGRVLDEEGHPLEGVLVWLDVQGRAPRLTWSDADGGFRFVARPAAEVVVGTARDVTSDVFEPPELRVPFGSSDLVLRRARSLAARAIAFEVVDLETGRPPDEGGGVFVLLGTPRAQGGWAWEELVEGRARVEVKGRSGLRWRVDCPGYLRREGKLDTATGADDGEPIRVALERGFERRLVIVDARSSRPLAQAAVFDPARSCSATTDASGLAVLRAPDWPARLRVECEGYREREIDPGDLELVDDRVALEPLSGG